VRYTLEIAVATPDEAVAAEGGGADRLELAAGLELGGLTPSMGLFARVRELARVPVWVLLRSRPGGFNYTPGEVEVMARDAGTFLDAGADGIVFGALDEAGGIDEQACRRIRDRSAGRMAFHRAFDFAAQPIDALEQLAALGFLRILTSGGQPTAREGSPRIAELIARAGGRIEIMPGGGVNPDNVARIVSTTGCVQVHAGARSAAIDRSLLRNLDLARALGAANLNTTATNHDLVAGLRRELDRLASLR
jgi:copper homeostasis protein CutC